MTVNISDRDRGFKRLLKRLTPKQSDVTVGIHEGEGSESHGDGGDTVVEVAAYHEFGGPENNPPRRSFIRDWVDENEQQHKVILRKLTEGVVAGRVPSVDVALEQFGALAVGQVQARIAGGIAPALAESTVKRKGSSVPLIDSGQLRSSVVFRVKK
jgi:hypothetical protein